MYLNTEISTFQFESFFIRRISSSCNKNFKSYCYISDIMVSKKYIFIKVTTSPNIYPIYFSSIYSLRQDFPFGPVTGKIQHLWRAIEQAAIFNFDHL